MKGKKSIRGAAITCPHCGSPAIVRSSEQMAPLCREVRLRCDNDDCAHQFVAQIEILRTVAPSLQPNPSVRLPLGNQNLRHPGPRPANDDAPFPANDDSAQVAFADGSILRSC